MRSCAEGVLEKEGGYEKIMAIFYMRTSIVRASSGKSAIASAAYQSGEKLYSERLGKSFSYPGKEEIVHTEILLPKNAPKEFLDREVLWNAVEEVQNKSNSRFARQFVIATPNEWTREETIEYSREFIQNSLVDRGMVVDWAYHEKEGDDIDNYHLHIMCTVRGFNPDGTWATMERKEYALDENGDRIPIIDPTTGEQKVRVRERNGHRSEEKLWKRITVQVNDWNSKEFLNLVKQEWANICNEHLSEKIDPRSYKERDSELLPMLHEGTAVREMSKRGIDTDISLANQQRKLYNDTLIKLQAIISRSQQDIDDTVNFLITGGKHEQLKRENLNNGTGNRDNLGIPGINYRAGQGDSEIARPAKRTQTDAINQIDQLQTRSNELVKKHKIRH